MRSGRTIEKALNNYELARQQLLEFMADHEDVFQEYDRLVIEYNKSIRDTKTEAKNIELVGRNSARLGPFQVIQTFKKYYDPEALRTRMPEVFHQPGVVTAVDKSVVNHLLDQGIVSVDVAQGSWVEEPLCRQVRGPKELNTDLTS